jgi:hypothetical protein
MIKFLTSHVHRKKQDVQDRQSRQDIPNVIQELVLAKLAPRILIRRSRRTNSSLLEIGGYLCGSKD